MEKEFLEKDYYPIVAKWLAKQYNCFQTDINTGAANSRADIVGVRDTGGDFSGEIETIIVEVKRAREPFSTASGQAYGYTIYGNRVYLADKRDDGFTQDEIMIANHIGIGLIQIDKNNRCKEILTSPYYKPLTKFNIRLLYRLSIARCQFCDTFFKIGDEKNKLLNVTRENVKKAIKEDKGIIFWHRELDARKEKFKTQRRSKDFTYERRYLCPECTNLLFTNRD